MNATQDLINLENYLQKIKSREYFTIFPENPKAYPDEELQKGEKDFHSRLNTNFDSLYSKDCEDWIGEEISPYLQVGLGIKYPRFSVEKLIQNAQAVRKQWSQTAIEKRTNILLKTLDAIKNRFAELAYATMHTTGQSFLMSFQASGPHALDRALETITMGYFELTRFAKDVTWTKNLGKFDLVLEKNFKPIPKGIGLVIGCTTFPTWNSLPGLYADLISGNPVIVKPHPKAIYPMAIVINEIQNELEKNGIDKRVVQLAVDKTSELITKQLCENPAIKLIDYTGGNLFGDYVEQLKNKETFTEKAGINSVMIDSCDDIQKVASNLAFSVCLYSGQMCTAPQNIYISKEGIKTNNGVVSFEDFKNIFSEAVMSLVNNPKVGAGTIGAIQNDTTIQRINDSKKNFSDIVLSPETFVNPEFQAARILTPTIVAVDSSQTELYGKEYFGPFSILIKTNSFEESLKLIANSASEKGAITCLAYCTDSNKSQQIEETMNEVFTPVSFNFSGAAFVNQHAAFSDLHVTGGNPAGNATFTDPNFVNRRFVWIGNRYMKQ
ncbi:MAG: aldehyde dehydrogenase family protein [Bacteroidetes bacterium]|nr:aldehyde dehydrogenase family protein [Bacteroidota bacterium]